VLPGSEKAALVHPAEEKPARASGKVIVSVIVKRKNPLKAAHISGKLRLTRAQYRQSHAADPGAVKLVRAFAKQYGLAIEADTPAPERRVIKLSGSVAQMQKAFGTALSEKTVDGVKYRIAKAASTFPASSSGTSKRSSGSTTARKRSPTFVSSASKATFPPTPRKPAALPSLTPPPATSPTHPSRSLSSTASRKGPPSQPDRPSASSSSAAATSRPTSPPTSKRSATARRRS
jgi:hypothetical protein